MEKSDYYYRRKYHMTNLILPTISEVKGELGTDLAESFFSLCPDPLKPLMGLGPPLSGAGNDLWISPSDVLIGKVCLKPPFTDKHMKALTHQGILKIGGDVEIKFWNEAELVKLRALAEQEELLLFAAEMDKRRAITEARLQERAICEEQKELMRIEFAEQLKFELQQLENRLRLEYKKLMREQKETLDEEWQDKLEEAVAEAIARLTEQFKGEMKQQEEELHRKFKIELKKEDIKRKFEIREMEECCKEAFVQLKHQLTCKNIANIMYILCTERRKCQTEIKNIEANYQKTIKELLSVISDRTNRIKALKKEVEKSKRELNLREECLLEIIRQFQKFVNFALKAAPTQGEFLLSVEKLMIFELIEAICRADEFRGKRLARQLMKWRSDVKLPTPNLSQETILLKNHHDCDNEVDTPDIGRSQLGSTDYLAAFNYGENMYVKEEFRNMMSQGIKVNPSNIYLWNKDVKHLQEILRRSVTSLQEQKQKEEEEKAQKKATEEVRKAEPLEKPSHHIRICSSGVYFKGADGNCGFVFPKFDSNSANLSITQSEMYDDISPQKKDSKTSIIMEGICCNPCTIPKRSKRKKIPVSASAARIPLIGTANSLELVAKESLRRSIYNPVFNESQEEAQEAGSNIGILSVKDSLLKHRMSMKHAASKVFNYRESQITSDILTLNKNSSETLIKSNSIFSSKYETVSSKLPDDTIIAPACKRNLLPEEQSIENQDNLDNSKYPSSLSFTRNSLFLHKQSIIKARSKHSINTNEDKNQEGTSSCKLDSPSLGDDLDTHLLIKRVHESSKLCLSRDSLELPSIHSRLSKLSKAPTGTYLQRSCSSKDSGQLQSDGLSHSSWGGARRMKKSDVCKTVLVSALKPRDHSDIKQTQVRMKAPCTEYDIQVLKAPDSLSLIYKNEEIDLKPRKDDFLTKPNVACVMGDRHSTEYKQKGRDFTLHRANSLLTCFRKHPSLIKIFTSVTK